MKDKSTSQGSLKGRVLQRYLYPVHRAKIPKGHTLCLRGARNKPGLSFPYSWALGECRGDFLILFCYGVKRIQKQTQEYMNVNI